MVRIQWKKESKSSLQSSHNSAAEFMRRICKSHRVITSQTIGVKLRWENTTLFFSEPHEKDSTIRMLSAADQESPLERKLGPAENVEEAGLCHLLVW